LNQQTTNNQQQTLSRSSVQATNNQQPTTERAYWLAWSKIPRLGPVLVYRIWQHFGSLEEAWTVPATALAEVEGLGGKLVDAVVQGRSRINPEELLAQHREENPCFWTPADEEYPRLLLEIPSPPSVLYYQGQTELLENQGITPAIAIVGTRSPTEHGRRWTRKISGILAKSGFVIVSGLAAGIDGEAHQGCLEVGGRTIAVLGTGVDRVYPWRHQELFEIISQQGLLLSEYAVGTKPDRGNFPARNRIIAGLSRAVLIMEAPEKSGALITARYGNEFGRDVYALPHSPDNLQYHGCLKLLRNGAGMIVGEEELLSMLGAIPALDNKDWNVAQEKKVEVKSLPDLSPELMRVIKAIAHEPTSFDVIVTNTGITASSVSAALVQLELLGLVSQLPGMRYQRC